MATKTPSSSDDKTTLTGAEEVSKQARADIEKEARQAVKSKFKDLFKKYDTALRSVRALEMEIKQLESDFNNGLV